MSSNSNFLNFTNNTKNNIIPESAFISTKRNRDENLLYNSPNLSAGHLKQLTPIYGTMSPNINKIFMFSSNCNNGSFTPTPLPVMNEFRENENVNSNKKISKKEVKETFQYGNIKNENNFSEDFRFVNSIVNNEATLDNGTDKINCSYLPNNFSNNNEFYSWVMQKTNTIYEDDTKRKMNKNKIKNSKIQNSKT